MKAPQQLVSLESLWAQERFRPNPQQEAAIKALSGPIYLTAGPGSGKTSVLVWRTLNLIVFHGISPERIFLGTFTEKGAHQLRERLRGLLAAVTAITHKPYDISRMAIGTIHSICHSLLIDRRLTPPGVRPRAPILLDQFAQYQFVYAAKRWNRLVESAGLGSDANAQLIQYFETRSSSSRHRAVVCAINFFNRMSEEALDLRSRRPSDAVVRALLKMYAEYRKMLEEDPDRQLSDLSLIQSHAYERVRASAAGGKLFDHVIVDEYQDTNAIQERLYFLLAKASRNLCVVGDDDQALYRFRGATVDNFLAFPARCQEFLGCKVTQIALTENYRSRRKVVAFYNAFMKQFQWKRGSTAFRVEKSIEAHSKDDTPAVFAATPAKPDDVAAEVAGAVRMLLDKGSVRDPSEIAFLFPSLGSTCVQKMKSALERTGLRVYAPRAGNFLEQEESLKMFGVFAQIFGHPEPLHREYADWLARAAGRGADLAREDRALARFIKDKQEEIVGVVADQNALLRLLKSKGREEDEECTESAGQLLSAAANLSTEVKQFLGSGRLKHYIREQRKRRPDRPITFRYIINRACSLDWGVLDLFYQLTAFEAFKSPFDLAASRTDEGPVCNLSVISDYLARFQEQTSPVISGQFLANGMFARKLFSSFLYSIFRLGEGEYEDKEDPFPKGRIPFLTVHQAKGLEFPVVVLGNLRASTNARVLDTLAVQLGAKRLEPEDCAPTFDMARMFYVALSRAKQTLILCPYKGAGQRYQEEFKAPIGEIAAPLHDLNPRTISHAAAAETAVPHPYSFTGDYIQYSICPRRYMVHRRYAFAPSRGQTMAFGNLVHRTIEDLHQFLIQTRGAQTSESSNDRR